MDDTPLADLPAPIAAAIEDASHEAAQPQRRPLRHQPAGGVRIGFTDPPRQPSTRATVTSAHNRAAIYSSIAGDLAGFVLEEGRVEVTGRLFLGPKDRPLFDIPDTNDAIPSDVKRVSYGSVLDVCAAGRVAVKLDLKAAFRSVTVAEADRPALGIVVDGVSLRYSRLPFGLATSPRIFVDLLRRTLDSVAVPPDCVLTSYVDDIAIVAPTAAQCAHLFVTVVRALLDDGWRVAVAKTFARPTRHLLFLGFDVDVELKAVAITEARRDKLVASLATARDGAHGWRDQLQRALGVIAWAAPALRGSGFVVPPCYRALRSGTVDGEAIDAIDVLIAIVRAGTKPTLMRPPSRMVTVVTDAGDKAWCAALCEEGVIVAAHRGQLPPEATPWSSTAREALAVSEAIRAFRLADGPLIDLGVHVSTDSQALAASVNRGRSRSVEVHRAMKALAQWCSAGLRVSASWTRRSEGFQPLVDAGTASAPRIWSPSDGLGRWLRSLGWIDVHIGAGDRHRSLGHAYTADSDDSLRSAVLASRPPGWRIGWIGIGTDVRVAGLTVLCHPRWGTEITTVARLRTAGRVILLSRDSMSSRRAFDGWSGGTVTVLPVPPPYRWWTSTDGAMYIDDLIVVDWARSAPSAQQARSQKLRRLALSSAYNPGPQHPRPKRLLQDRGPEPPASIPRAAVPGTRHVGLLASLDRGSLPAPPTTPVALGMTPGGLLRSLRPAIPPPPRGPSSSAGLLRSLRPTTPRPPPEPPRRPPTATTPRPASHGTEKRCLLASLARPATPGTIDKSPPCVDSPRPPAPVPVHTTDPTCRLVVVLRAVADGHPLRLAGVGDQIGARADAAAARVRAARKRRKGAHPRARYAAIALADFVERLGDSDAAFSLAALDATAVAYADARIQGSDGLRQVEPSTVSEELSSVAAALRAAGLRDVPHYLGPRATDYLRARGASQRRDHSNALPLTLRWLLSVKPPAGSADHPVWASRVLQSGFMLRPGCVLRLRAGNLTPWGPGLILTWTARDKTRQGDVCADGDAIQPQWRVTGCAQPTVVAVVSDYLRRADSPSSLLFPGVTSRRVSAWLHRTRIVDSLETPRLTAHGFRLGTDMELHQLGVPAEVINLIGYWSREAAPGKSTKAYYNSVHVGAMYLATSRLGTSDVRHPAPGVHVGPEALHIRWEAEYPGYTASLPASLPPLRPAALAAARRGDDSSPSAQSSIDSN